MKVSGHQVQGKRSGREMVGVVLHVGGEQSAAVVRPLVRLSPLAGRVERDGGNRLEVPPLASFAGAKRTQWAALTEAAVLVGLRKVVTGVTCLASVRPMSPRLTVAPIVLASRGGGFSLGRVARNGLVESARGHDVETVVDEGGIYSW